MQKTLWELATGICAGKKFAGINMTLRRHSKLLKHLVKQKQIYEYNVPRDTPNISTTFQICNMTEYYITSWNIRLLFTDILTVLLSKPDVRNFCICIHFWQTFHSDTAETVVRRFKSNFMSETILSWTSSRNTSFTFLRNKQKTLFHSARVRLPWLRFSPVFLHSCRQIPGWYLKSG
jgi:hypothetical protein